MTLFLPATANAVDDNGNAASGARWYFYRKETLTAASTSGGTSVEADSNGAFADITLSVGVDYRAILRDANGNVLLDLDAYSDSLFSPGTQSATDANGNVLSGAVWKFYTTGTTTAQTVYADADQTTPLGSSITADASGRFPETYLDSSVTYKAVLEDSSGTELASIDPVTVPNMWGYLDPTATLEVEPGASWDGTAGSGFSSAPSDPTRTTAKPVCRLLVPPFQYFTDTLTVGVWAAANNSGSLLDNLGLEKVRVYFEDDAPTDIMAPSFHTFNDVNGNSVTYYGWWITLKKPTGTAGHANVYFEAVPSDATMQNRVMGPYQFSPVATLHDYEIEVAATPAEIAGTRYKTVLAAINYLVTQSAQNPKITITEGGTLEPPVPNYYAGGNGYLTITATVPVTFKKASFTSEALSLFRFRYDGIRFMGSNITLDLQNARQIYHELGANKYHWFDGVTLTDSGGRYYLMRGQAHGQTPMVRDGVWLTECTISYIQGPAQGASLARGCSFTGIFNDVGVNCACFIGNTVEDQSSEEYRAEINAFTVTGPAGATLELSGANGANNRVFNAKVSGVSSGTFTVLNTEAGWTADTNYTVQNVVDWINGLGGGWSATLLDDTRAAHFCGLAGGAGGAFSATDCSSGLTVVTMIDQHADVWGNDGSLLENLVCVDNTCWDINAQGIYLAVSNSKDAVIANNSLHGLNGNYLSQWAGTQSNIFFGHNSWTGQNIVWRADTTYNPDARCVFANNTAPVMAWNSGTTDADLVIANNHLQTGGTAPSGATGTTIGGSQATLFTDAANGDFTPAGDLLTNLKTPVLTYDANGTARGATAAAGALS